MLTYKTDAPSHCRQVESFLLNLLPGSPLSYIHKLIRSGSVTVNHEPATPERLLHLGDTVAIKESQRLLSLMKSAPPSLDLLYHDDRIAVFNKEPGLPVHRTAEHERDLVTEGSAFLSSGDIRVNLRPVNRLDRGTSGVIILAKSATAAGMFGRMVKEEGLGKVYLAIAGGALPEKGEIATPLDGKESLTRYRRILTNGKFSFVAVYPVTGRTHQIRLHFQEIGHAIVGDRRYRGRPLPDYAGHLLHSFRTTLVHPETEKELTLFAPLPKGFLDVLQEMAGEQFEAVLRGLQDQVAAAPATTAGTA